MIWIVVLFLAAYLTWLVGELLIAVTARLMTETNIRRLQYPQAFPKKEPKPPKEDL